MGARLGIGLIGAGRMGSTHARILARAVPEARLVAMGIHELDPARRLMDDEVLGPSGSVFVGLLPLGGGAFAGPAGFSIDTLPTSEPRFGRALAEQARAFARAILEDRPVEVGGSESRSALAIALAARRSLETGEPVRVVTVAG